MGRSKGRKKRRDESPEISLLGAAFNLPTRRTIERDLRAARAQAQQVKVVYDSDDEEDGPSEDESSSSSDDEDPDSEDDKSQVKQVPRPPTPPRALSGRGRKLRARNHSEPPKEDRQCLKSSPIPPRKASKSRSSRTSKEPSQPRRGRKQASPAKDTFQASFIPSSATFPLPLPSQPTAGNDFMPPMASVLPGSAAFQPSNVLRPYQLYPAFPPPNTQPPTFAQTTYRPDPIFAPRYVSETANVPAPETSNNFHPIPTIATTSSYSKPVGALATRLQRLQHEIDRKTSELQARPLDPVLNEELDALRKELNMALNDAMLPKTSCIREGGKPRGTDLLNKQPDDYRSHNGARFADTLSQPFLNPEPSNTQTEVVRESSPERGPRHHLCSSCGIVRSRRYHEKYPVAPNKPYTGSLCEGCRNRMLRRGVFGPRAQHACFGCGVYRSKQFNEKHPAEKGGPLLPNYCNKCQKEMRSAEGIANASMINSCTGIDEEANESTDDVNEMNRNEKYEADVVSHGHDLSPMVRGRMAHQTRSRSPRDETTSRPSQVSPHFQRRKHGSSKRRAQRGSAAYDESLPEATALSREGGNYEPPSVEDVASPSIAHESAAPKQGRKKENGNPGPSSPTTKPFGPPVASESVDTRSSKWCPGPREESRNGSISPQESMRSRRSCLSSKSNSNSSGSTASKSVKFNPSVGVRRSHSRSDSDVCSNAEIEETEIKPNDSSTPTREGIYGSFPLMDETSRPLSTLDRLRLRYELEQERLRSDFESQSRDHQESLHEHPEWPQPTDTEPPLQFSRGAFSKESGFTPKWDWSGFKRTDDPTDADTDHGASRRPPANEVHEDSESFAQYHFNDFSGENGQHDWRNTPSPCSSRPRSAFASYFSDAPRGYDSGMGKGPQSRRPTPAGFGHHQRDRDAPDPHGAQHAEPAFRPASTAGAFSFTKSDGDPAPGIGTFSQSDCNHPNFPNGNPYYKPRPQRAYSFNNFSHHTEPAWFGNDREGSTWAKEPKHNENIYFPEPVIEEPESEISSPVAQTYLLEYDAVPVLDLHTTEEPDLEDLPELDDSVSDDDSQNDYGAPEVKDMVLYKTNTAESS